VLVHSTDPKRRRQLLARPADFYITNYEGPNVGATVRVDPATKRTIIDLDGLALDLAQRPEIQIIVIDEAGAYRGPFTKRGKIARHLLSKRHYLWLLTGTPTPNAPTDAYGLARLVNNADGKSFVTFRNETMYQPKKDGFKWLPRPGGYEKARALLHPAIRFAIEDVWDAPELTTQQRVVKLSAEQERHLAELKRHLQVELKSGVKITAINAAAYRSKALQISLGSIYDGEHKSHDIDAGPRYDELKWVLDEAPSKFVVWAPLTNVVHRLRRFLREEGWNVEIINGETSLKDRTAIIRAFQDGDDIDGIVGDPTALGLGVDLWRGRTSIWFGPTDKNELYRQGNKRLHRPGQQFPVTIVQMLGTKTERVIYEGNDGKENSQQELLSMVQRGEF